MGTDGYRGIVAQVMLDAIAGGPDVPRAFSSSGTEQASAVGDVLATFSWTGLSVYAGEVAVRSGTPTYCGRMR